MTNNQARSCHPTTRFCLRFEPKFPSVDSLVPYIHAIPDPNHSVSCLAHSPNCWSSLPTAKKALTSLSLPRTHTFANKTTKQIEFVDGQTESVVSLPITLDTEQDEGCESVTVGVTAVTGTGSAVVDGGIHDVSAEASVRIEENSFTSAVLDFVPREGLDVAGGLLSPATARVGGGWVGGRCQLRCIVEELSQAFSAQLSPAVTDSRRHPIPYGSLSSLSTLPPVRPRTRPQTAGGARFS